MQGLRSPKPCLTCLASKEETLSSSLGNIQLRRNSDLNPFIRKKPFSIYGKKLRNEEITVEEEKKEGAILEGSDSTATSKSDNLAEDNPDKKKKKKKNRK
jgi:hypothetical protein